MVAGDLVNTASRVQSAAAARHRARRRGDRAAPPRPRSRTRTPGSTSSKGRPSRCPCGALCGSSQRAAARAAALASRRRSSGARPSSGSSRSSSMRPPTRARARLVSVVGVAGIGKSRLAWEFEKYIDGLATTFAGTADAASRTAKGSRSGHSPRWSGRVPASSRTSRLRLRAGQAPGVPSRSHVPDPDERRLDRAATRASARPRRASRARSRGPFLGLAALLRAPRRARPTVLVFEDLHWADPGAARLRRVPARVVALLPDLRAHPRTPRARSSADPTGAPADATSISLFLEPLPDDPRRSCS